MSEHAEGGELAIVLWAGDLGGAETFSAHLAAALRTTGVDARILFLVDEGQLGTLLDRLEVPYSSLGLERGGLIARHPRRFAAAVARAGARWALLVSANYMGAVLRAGGYRGTVVGTEHGELMLAPGLPRITRVAHALGRRAAARTNDAEVAVSDFMLRDVLTGPHAAIAVRIHNGIDLRSPRWLPSRGRGRGRQAGELVVGHAARLIEGKGTDDLVRAVASAKQPCRLAVAGDGPRRASLESLVRSLGAAARVDLRGLVEDIVSFWRGCDVAAIPSSTFIESFGMVAVEAMALGMPVVATRNGALPELVVDGTTGTLVHPGDSAGLAAALDRYAADPELRRRHGTAGRQRCEEHFSIERCAREYIDLFHSLERPAVA